MDPSDARKELVRRFLHIYGPSTPEAFAAWTGVRADAAARRFEELRRSLTAVRTPVGDAWVLTRDVDTLRRAPATPDAVRLLPSGDPYYLLQGRERSLVVPRADRQGLLWTSRVWPGAMLAGGEVVGTWRRTGGRVTAHPWKRLSKRVREAFESEAGSLPLPGEGAPRLDWTE